MAPSRIWDWLGFTGNTSRALARKMSATFISLGHVGLGVLAATHHLAYANPSRYPFLTLVNADHVWIVVHFGVAAFIAFSLVRNQWHITAMSMSAGWMGAFGFLSLLSGATSVGPVGLAGPVLALALSGTAYSIAMSWAVAPHQHTEQGVGK